MGFFQRLKKEVWKVVRGILILIISASLVFTIIHYAKKTKKPDSVSLIIDSDSANDIDDLFAITIALVDPKIHLTGLNSAQWNIHPRGGDSSVYQSQKINEELLLLHDRTDIPHPTGGADQTGYWGDTKPIESAAATLIRSEAKKLKYGEKLNVVTLGAPTNLASAILLDTTLIGKVRWYALGMKYDEKTQVWNKNEFNVRNDLDAVDYLLNREDLETHIMPANIAEKYVFNKTETFDLFLKRGPKYDFLVDRWRELFFDDRNHFMWDLALIQAIMNPDLVTEKELYGPPENFHKRIFVYTWIDEEKFHREFRKLVRKDLNDLSSDAEN